MKKHFTTLSLCLTLFANAQTQYVKDFTPVLKDFSEFGFGNYGFAADFQNPRRCVFNDLYQFNQQGSYSRQIYDPQAQNFSPSWDSIIYIFKYKTSGYAKNFNITVQSPSNTNVLYNLTNNYNLPDSQIVRLKLGLFYTYYSGNFIILLNKQDSTLNNFTVTLSNLDIKGYLHYGTVGINQLTKKESNINFNNETLFFDEKWLNKKYWINDIYGKIVFSGIVNSLQEKINLENGLYILNTEVSSQKMIISPN